MRTNDQTSILTFKVLGPVTVHGPAGTVDIGPPRHRKLLAMLLLHHGHPVPVGRLVDAVWDRRPPATAREQLHNGKAALRRTLTSAGADPDLISTTTAGIRISTTGSALDLAVLETFVAASRTAADPLDAAALLGQATDLWTGPSLGGLTGHLLDSAARRLDDRRLSLLEDRYDLEIANRRGYRHVAELADLVAAHPYRERLVGQLMLALYQNGQTAEALDVFRRTSAGLRHDLGIEAGPALAELHRAILRRDAGLPYLNG